mmetsp:Transcript_6396/g.7321  ORF Transcript_6396/g.7321 Transcript_6396/m.7321 type:complete len:280 (-) Transcript_6396:131-970(-)|eukprot:CAMPEP_0204830914 /NCGR_PEP_ID=MMETSP1346-20131115/9487_1 /ASSEMBLY_ACC=CAM_ASM_000771 /TAXON_ID=215587 /ORGANISM="Aplanochytrium stocchinoi, Strain GSBS06" /LENGTH=279 /DNA_ID=CAMNT_0051961527 /DNA_START=365 /DNA_END=1204 /DNA_ORIENTATION=-
MKVLNGLNDFAGIEGLRDPWFGPEIVPDAALSSYDDIGTLKTVSDIAPVPLDFDFGLVDEDEFFGWEDPLERAFFQELASTRQHQRKKSISLDKPKTIKTVKSSGAKPGRKRKLLKTPTKEKKSKIEPADKGSNKRRRRCNEWTPEDVVLLLNCTKILVNFELKTISEALFLCIKRNPGKCKGRAAEKKLKRLGIFENWKTADKNLVVTKIDKKLEEFGETGKYLCPDLVTTTKKIIEENKSLFEVNQHLAKAKASELAKAKSNETNTQKPVSTQLVTE